MESQAQPMTRVNSTNTAQSCNTAIQRVSTLPQAQDTISTRCYSCVWLYLELSAVFGSSETYEKQVEPFEKFPENLWLRCS